MKDKRDETEDVTKSSASQAKQIGAPVYQKPVLRRYDQIGQVKPYGPSELESG
jgi:hypothetical protein